MIFFIIVLCIVAHTANGNFFGNSTISPVNETVRGPRSRSVTPVPQMRWSTPPEAIASSSGYASSQSPDHSPDTDLESVISVDPVIDLDGRSPDNEGVFPEMHFEGGIILPDNIPAVSDVPGLPHLYHYMMEWPPLYVPNLDVPWLCIRNGRTMMNKTDDMEHVYPNRMIRHLLRAMEWGPGFDYYLRDRYSTETLNSRPLPGCNLGAVMEHVRILRFRHAYYCRSRDRRALSPNVFYASEHRVFRDYDGNEIVVARGQTRNGRIVPPYVVGEIVIRTHMENQMLHNYTGDWLEPAENFDSEEEEEPEEQPEENDDGWFSEIHRTEEEAQAYREWLQAHRVYSANYYGLNNETRAEMGRNQHGTEADAFDENALAALNESAPEHLRERVRGAANTHQERVAAMRARAAALRNQTSDSTPPPRRFEVPDAALMVHSLSPSTSPSPDC